MVIIPKAELIQHGYRSWHDETASCRLCNSDMYVRKSNGAAHTVCPECGYNTARVECQLSVARHTSVNGNPTPGRAIYQLQIKLHSGELQILRCGFRAGQTISFNSGDRLVLHFVCGDLEEVENTTMFERYWIELSEGPLLAPCMVA